jgi:hypothetical protein
MTDLSSIHGLIRQPLALSLHHGGFAGYKGERSVGDWLRPAGSNRTNKKLNQQSFLARPFS